MSDVREAGWLRWVPGLGEREGLGERGELGEPDEEVDELGEQAVKCAQNPEYHVLTATM